MRNNTKFQAILFFIAAFICLSADVHAKTIDSLSAKDLHPFGRYIYNHENNLELVSSAVHFGFTFVGKECNIFASIKDKSGHNYLQYEMDGEYVKRIKIEGNSAAAIVLTAATGGKHTVWIYKATEAHTGAIVIQKITGKNLKPLQKHAAPVIEFIGNSITCGAAADASEVPCGTGAYHDQHNAYMAYGPRVARALATNFIVSSVSGIGVYRNWNSTSPTMPQVYEKTDLQENSSQLWNFKLYTPKVVSIALGTNDFSNGDGIKKRLPFDSSAFISTYVGFIQTVKSKYPKARIALLSSPMMNGSARILLQNCLTSVKAKVDALYPSEKKVAIFFFDPMQAHGCGGHPSVEDHEIMAKELIPFFKKLL